MLSTDSWLFEDRQMDLWIVCFHLFRFVQEKFCPARPDWIALELMKRWTVFWPWWWQTQRLNIVWCKVPCPKMWSSWNWIWNTSSRKINVTFLQENTHPKRTGLSSSSYIYHLSLLCLAVFIWCGRCNIQIDPTLVLTALAFRELDHEPSIPRFDSACQHSSRPNKLETKHPFDFWEQFFFFFFLT